MTRIIRAHPDEPPRRRSRPGSTRVLRASQIQAQSEAEQILARARREAEAILVRARAEAENLRQQATAQGQAGATRILTEARDRARREADQARDSLTQLAVRIAEKLLGEELSLHPDRIVSIVRECLKRAVQGRRIVVRVNPGDLQLVEDALERLEQGCQAEVLQVKPDDAVDRGGCIVETELGQLDGRLDSQLDAILAGLGQQG